MAKKQRRALVPTGIVILAVLSGVNYFFAPVDSATASGGNGSGIQQNSLYGTSPEWAVQVVYNRTAEGVYDQPCWYFTQQAGQVFAKALGATTCEDALRRITDKSGYRELTIRAGTAGVSGTTATIDSCQLPISGQRLGVFTLTRQADRGWRITDYKNETC